MKTLVQKKPIGKIKIVARIRTPRGKIFSPGEIHEYYSILDRRDCNCGNKQGKLLYKVYKTKYGNVPTSKAMIIKTY